MGGYEKSTNVVEKGESEIFMQKIEKKLLTKWSSENIHPLSSYEFLIIKISKNWFEI